MGSIGRIAKAEDWEGFVEALDELQEIDHKYESGCTGPLRERFINYVRTENDAFILQTAYVHHQSNLGNHSEHCITSCTGTSSLI